VNSKQTGLYGLLLVIMAGSGWLLFRQETVQPRKTASDTGPDAFVEGMDLMVMNEQGQLGYRFKARRMKHYPSDERFLVENPDIKIVQDNGDTWLIKSEHGETTEDADIIWLLGAVDIKRQQTATSSAVHIVTRDLQVRPGLELAETEQAATITADQLRVEGVGIKADFRNDTMELKSSVRGSYDGAS
jgi:lipopolysaccharide export system protein LptC